MNVSTRMITSIGGGISLNPRDFKQTIIDRDSPAIREVVQIKNKLTPTGNISQADDWLRSNTGGGVSRINELPRISWDLSKSENGKVKYDYRSESGDVALLEFSQDMKKVEYNLQVNGYKDVLKYSKEENVLEVAHNSLTGTYKGEVSADGKYIVFSK